MPDMLPDRFWAKVQKTSGCWVWTAALDRYGYGHFGMDGRHYRAHRLVWASVNGPISDGLLVCHKCDNMAHDVAMEALAAALSSPSEGAEPPLSDFLDKMSEAALDDGSIACEYEQRIKFGAPSDWEKWRTCGEAQS